MEAVGVRWRALLVVIGEWRGVEGKVNNKVLLIITIQY